MVSLKTATVATTTALTAALAGPAMAQEPLDLTYHPGSVPGTAAGQLVDRFRPAAAVGMQLAPAHRSLTGEDVVGAALFGAAGPTVGNVLVDRHPEISPRHLAGNLKDAQCGKQYATLLGEEPIRDVGVHGFAGAAVSFRALESGLDWRAALLLTAVTAGAIEVTQGLEGNAKTGKADHPMSCYDFARTIAYGFPAGLAAHGLMELARGSDHPVAKFAVKYIKPENAYVAVYPKYDAASGKTGLAVSAGIRMTGNFDGFSGSAK